MNEVQTGRRAGPTRRRHRFIFAYVDLFSLYRPDVRADLAEGKLFLFDVNETFLLATTLYVVIPSLMIYALTLVMSSRRRYSFWSSGTRGDWPQRFSPPSTRRPHRGCPPRSGRYHLRGRGA